MCGIFGLINTPWQENFLDGLRALNLRGPDDTSSWVDKNVLLGHTRLSVIDINGGHQPMLSKNSHYVLVFNGEIYNFRELRKELEKYGYIFTTHSDTEILLHGYREWRDQLPLHLDGMFSFVIWDTYTQSLFAARDRVGIKPLFYSVLKGFAFSSTLEPFFKLKGFPRRLNYHALRDYLAFQTCFAPDSFIKDVCQLPPASQLKWNADTKILKITRYWAPPRINHALDKNEIIEQVDAALSSSVRRQLVSDVPLGAFLSGGIDSSLMIHYMNKAGVKPIDTFTLSFEQAEYDETPYALEVSKKFECNHHTLKAPEIDGQSWVDSINFLDQPLADPAYVMTNALSQLTRQHVTVAISGDGSDELFAGYERFKTQASDLPKRIGQDILREMIERGWLPEALLSRTLYGKELLLYRQVELGPWTKGRKSLSHYLQPEVFDICEPENTIYLWRDLSEEMDTRGLMHADLWTYLSENCLTKTDRSSMAHSLEVRVPMLGNDLLDLAPTIPTSYHFDSGGGKRILRELAKRHLPESTWNRKKHGFSVPLQGLFNSSWQEPIDDLIYRSASIAPFLNEQSIRVLWADAKNKRGSRRLAYTFAVLLQWLDSNNISH